uniref:Putative product n=1 Tax=Xenopsylla cheopis TaxID=163159 RepID=A0A6M2E438_XENCH
MMLFAIAILVMQVRVAINVPKITLEVLKDQVVSVSCAIAAIKLLLAILATVMQKRENVLGACLILMATIVSTVGRDSIMTL